MRGALSAKPSQSVASIERGFGGVAVSPQSSREGELPKAMGISGVYRRCGGASKKPDG